MCMHIVYKGCYDVKILNTNCWAVRPTLLLLDYAEVTYQIIQINVSV